MTSRAKFYAAAAIGIAIAAASVATIARAQASAVAAAIDAGTVGEQADGYLGVRGAVSAAIKSGMLVRSARLALRRISALRIPGCD